MAKFDVFLSYSRRDAERVGPLRDELRRMGYRVFFDTQSIDPGDKWKTRLERAVKGSRTLVLCWSEHTKGSDYITFEYSRAEALGRPILPWLMDGTALPAMLEVQGITLADPVAVAEALRSRLGWPMGARNGAKAAGGAVAAVVLGVGLWLALKPPPPAPPWELKGQVVDIPGLTGIGGVTVEARRLNSAETATGVTGADGRYDLRLAAPRPETVHMTFSANGYKGDEVDIPTGAEFKEQMFREK